MIATVSCDWLSQNLDAFSTVILDASLAPVGAADQPAVAECIPGAIRFSIEDISAPDALNPHTLLCANKFQLRAREASINRDSQIIVYDSGIYSAPRVWWNFKITGHDDVFVLDGGLAAWKHSGGATASIHDTPSRYGNYVANGQNHLVATVDEVLAAINDPATKIIDVRNNKRYTGQEGEPRPGLRKGHMPSSINIPYSRFLSGSYLQDAMLLKKIFVQAGCTPDHRLIFSCGSGVTACIGLLAAYACGFRNISLYDGSWAEWGANPDLPVATN